MKLTMIVFLLLVGCTKNYYEMPDPDPSKPLPPENYTYFSVNPPDDLSQYAYIFQGRNSFTVSFWYEGQINGWSEMLFSISNNSMASDVSIKQTEISFRRFIYGANASCDAIVELSNTLWYGKHHVVITYDGSYQTIYVDGVLLGKQLSTYSINSTRISFRSENGNRWRYSGKISNAYFYERSLTKEEAYRLYTIDAK